MPNNLSIIVDHYFDLIDEEPTNYKRHLKPAKDLLELCDSDIAKAVRILEETKDWVNGFGEEWTIETAIKYWIKNKIKRS